MRVDTPGTAATFPAKADVQGGKPAKQPGPEQLFTSKGTAEHTDQSELVNVKKLKDAVEITNKAIRFTNYHLQFRLHEASGRYHVKVVDSESQQVIREIPPEKMLDFSARIKEMLDDMVGVFFDELA